MIRFLFFFLLLLNSSFLLCQYAPAAGQPGSTAIHMDSSVFVSWATGCEITRGFQNIDDPTLGKAADGDETMATGKALSNGIVSLGDGGSATCTFQFPIRNGPGFDFAIFENAFADIFLELAFVEVSSNGSDFFRFPAHSLTDTVKQTESFGSTDPTKINNLAGKYKSQYGTPFDLEELASNPSLNVNSITHIRVVDVVGSVQSKYATRDSQNRMINDPWPTPFSASGFDLDAIGVIHHTGITGIDEVNPVRSALFYPNPATVNSDITFNVLRQGLVHTIYDAVGRKLFNVSDSTIVAGSLMPGIYFVTVAGSAPQKLVITEGNR